MSRVVKGQINQIIKQQEGSGPELNPNRKVPGPELNPNRKVSGPEP